jgi:hypothetical protein
MCNSAIGLFCFDGCLAADVHLSVPAACSAPSPSATSRTFSGSGILAMVALITSLAGHELLSLPGLGPTTVITLISECGLDMSRWPSAKHFVSWLGLSPHNKICGGLVLSSRTRQGEPGPAVLFGRQQCQSAEPTLPLMHSSGDYLQGLVKGRH